MRITLKKFSLSLAIGLLTLGSSAVPAAAHASRDGANHDANDALQLVINRGNSEISRRLTTLNTLSGKITGAKKLSADDKATLSQEVTDEISGLTALKTKLDAETDVSAARTDAQGIISDYRVYALLVPKVQLVRVADDQQVAEDKLSALATKLQARVTSSSPSALKSALSDMTSKVTAAQGISGTVQSKVIVLQPSDYNSDHSALSGYRNQLKTAQSDIQAAVSDAKTIIAGLKADK